MPTYPDAARQRDDAIFTKENKQVYTCQVWQVLGRQAGRCQSGNSRSGSDNDADPAISGSRHSLPCGITARMAVVSPEGSGCSQIDQAICHLGEGKCENQPELRQEQALACSTLPGRSDVCRMLAGKCITAGEAAMGTRLSLANFRGCTWQNWSTFLDHRYAQSGDTCLSPSACSHRSAELAIRCGSGTVGSNVLSAAMRSVAGWQWTGPLERSGGAGKWALPIKKCRSDTGGRCGKTPMGPPYNKGRGGRAPIAGVLIHSPPTLCHHFCHETG